MIYLVFVIIIAVLAAVIYFQWKNGERRLIEIDEKYKKDILRIADKVASLKNESKEVNIKIKEIVDDVKTLDNDTVKHLLDDIKLWKYALTVNRKSK